MTRLISVIIGPTGHGRFSEKPAQWILQQLRKRDAIEAQLLDLRDFPMPFFDQPVPPVRPSRPPYEHDVAKKGTAQIQGSILRSNSRCDALGAFSSWGRRPGPRRAAQSSQRHDRGPALVAGSSQDGPQALRCGQ